MVGKGNIRINVYWTTGTVGTCLDHPRQGKTQLFRRNVDLSSLRAIFQNPRTHTGSGYHTVDQMKENIQASENGSCTDLESEAKMQMKRLEEESREIEREKARVQEILDAFEEERKMERKRKEEAEAAAERERVAKRQREEAQRQAEEAERKRALLDARRYSRGKYIDYSLVGGDHVNECFGETVTSMACGGRATILFYENGGWAWTSGLTNQLHNKLKGRQRSLPSPKYVAMGSQDRYYVEFEDGKSQWVGCDAMTNEINNSNRIIKTVAFGEDWDSYFIVYTDGGWSYNNIPSGLDDLIERRRRKGDLDCVSLGPDGEYFISAKNGKMWWGGMTQENMNIVAKHKKDDIRFIDFDDNDCFFVRYS